MKERPILFSGPMVSALLAGAKSQTRRLINPQPSVGDGGCWYPEPPRKPAHRARHYANEAHLRNGLPVDFCPYGQPGDLLWVRETFAPEAMEEHVYRVNTPWSSSIRYAADRALWAYEDARAGRDWYIPEGGGHQIARWKPSIFMPRWASRLTLEVTEVRVDRDPVSEEDALAEGIVKDPRGLPRSLYVDAITGDACHATASAAYTALFEHINGLGSIDKWRWAISFRMVP